MNKRTRTRIIIPLIFFLVLLSGAAAFLLFIAVTNVKPLPREPITTGSSGITKPVGTRDFSFLTWNIGYAARRWTFSMKEVNR
jgi:hypothetical protein